MILLLRHQQNQLIDRREAQIIPTQNLLWLSMWKPTIINNTGMHFRDIFKCISTWDPPSAKHDIVPIGLHLFNFFAWKKIYFTPIKEIFASSHNTNLLPPLQFRKHPRASKFNLIIWTVNYYTSIKYESCDIKIILMYIWRWTPAAGKWRGATQLDYLGVVQNSARFGIALSLASC